MAVEKKKRPYRLIIGLLLFLAGMLNYLDRAALSVAAPVIKHDLGLDDAHMGILFSAFFVGYCVFCFVGGWAADRFGPRKVFAYAAGFWSIFCGATALMTSFGQLLFVRVLFGVGEGPMGTTTNKSITNWFPREEAGRAVGLTNAGQPLGAAIAAPIVGLVALHYGWRISFVVVAALGLLWLAAWLTCFRDDPAKHPRVSPEEAALIKNSRSAPVADRGDDGLQHGVWHYILSKRVIGVAMAFFCFNYVLYFLLSWLPSYLIDYQHLNIKQMSVVGTLPWLGATLGFVLGGILSDVLLKRSGNVLFARKTVVVVGLGVSAVCALLISQVSALVPAVALIALASLFAFMTPQACWALLQDIVPGKRVGAAGGFVHLLANLAGILSPSLTGFIVQYGGGYRVAFVFVSVLSAVGVVSALLLVRPQKTDVAGRMSAR